MGAQIKVVTEFTAKDKFSDTVKKMVKNMKSFSVKGVAYMDRIENKAMSLYKSMGALQRLGFGLGLAYMLREGLNGILDFEDGLVLVKKTTGLADKEIQGLGKEVLKLDKNLKGIGSEKLLEVAGVAGQMGVDNVDDILKFSEVMVKLEKATDVVGEEGASKISRLLTITKEGVGVIDKFGSSLVALGNNSAAFESEILEVASEVGRGVAAYDLGSANILGISAALKSLDVNPQAGGTAISKTFRQIELATLKGGRKLKAISDVIGLSPKEIQSSFGKDPQQVFMQFIKGLNRISSEGGSVTNTLIEMGLSGQIVGKGIIPLSTNYKLLSEKVELANKSFKDNLALNKEFTESTKTVRSAAAELMNAWKRVNITLFGSKDSLTTLRKLMYFIADNMETIIKLAAGLLTVWVATKTALVLYNKYLLAKNVLMGVSAALTGQSTLLIAGNTTALGANTAALWVMNTATKAMAIAQEGLNIVMSMNPIGLLIIAIAALSYVVYKIIKGYDKWGAAATFLLGPLGMMINLVMSFVRHWDMIKDSFKNGGILKGFLAISKVILDGLLYPMEQLFNLLSKVPGLGFLEGGANFVRDIRHKLELDKSDNKSTAFNSPESITANSVVEKSTNNNLNINIKKERGFDIDTQLDGPSDIPILLTPTT